MRLILVGLIRVYQVCVSPYLGAHCRFRPTCSEYAIEALRRRGLVQGLRRSLGRLCRCHPLGGAGFDPVD